MCAVWAIRTSCGNYDKSMQLQGKVEAALGIESLPEWNDAPGRTKEEVIAALESVGL